MAHMSFDHITKDAKTTKGMNKNQTVLFHIYNPNGLVQKLPKFDDLCHGDVFFAGLDLLYNRFNNYHAKWLEDVAFKPSTYTRWQLGYHLAELQKDVDASWEAIYEKICQHDPNGNHAAGAN